MAIHKKNKTGPLNFIIDLQIYPFDVVVSIAQSDEQLLASFKKIGYQVTADDDGQWKYTSERCQGRAASLSNGAYILRLRKYPHDLDGMRTLSHEIFHIASYVMYKIGVKLMIMKSDEAYAYLVGFITKKVYEKIGL